MGQRDTENVAESFVQIHLFPQCRGNIGRIAQIAIGILKTLLSLPSAQFSVLNEFHHILADSLLPGLFIDLLDGREHRTRDIKYTAGFYLPFPVP
jgi:hypothetical protein